jgi:predicted permease
MSTTRIDFSEGREMRVGELWRRLLLFVRRDGAMRDLEDEMRLHVELRAARYEQTGMSGAQASSAARRRFGNAPAYLEDSRDAWGVRLFDVLAQDFRHAARGLRRRPGFAAVVVVTLALGLGVNAAIFSLLDRLFVQPPAGVAKPGDVHRLYLSERWSAGTATVRDAFNYPELEDLVRGAGPSVPLAAYRADSTSVGDGDGARSVVVAYTTANYWSVLGAAPRMGRAFTPAEARIETPANVVVISDAFWRGQLAGRASVVGTQLRLGGRPYTIIGVAPPNFVGPDVGAVGLWLPIGDMPMAQYGSQVWYQMRSSPLLRVLFRSPPGSAPGVVGARLTAAFRAGALATGRFLRDSSAVVSTGSIIAALGPLAPKQEVVISTRLVWVSLLVLLIACANVANLLLSRMVERRGEVALRLALGVSRRRLASQVFAECLLLALLAGVVALGVGAWAAAALRATLLPGVHWSGSVMQWQVALLTTLVALVCACAAGLAPTLQSRAIRGGETVSPRAGKTLAAGRMRSTLVVIELALTVVLLTGAGLFIQSLRRLTDVDFGYDVERIVMAEPTLLGDRGGSDANRNGELGARLEEVAARMSGAPGIASVALAWNGPMAGFSDVGISRENGDTLPQLNGSPPALIGVSPTYWRTVGLRLERGRLLDARDRAGAAPTIVVNESMARTVWNGRDPIGQCLIVYSGVRGAPCRTVVGVVSDAHRLSIDEPADMQFYLPLDQSSPTGTPSRVRSIIVRTNGSAGAAPRGAALLQATIRATLHDVAPNVTDMHQLIAPQFHPWRLGAALFTALGLLALVVAAVGLYGVIAYNVRGRTHELGVRIALGAEQSRVVRLVVVGGVQLALLGVIAGVIGGVIGALAARRFVASLLYGTSTHDPSVLAGVAITMLATALAASLVPAWRAAHVDPMVALRSE